MKTLTIKRGDYVGFGWQTNAGKPSKGERVATARLRVPLNRYTCGMTVGGGWFQHFDRTDPVGAECGVYGIFADGRIVVMLPGAGCATLGISDVEVINTDALTEQERRALAELPARSQIRNGEIEP